MHWYLQNKTKVLWSIEWFSFVKPELIFLSVSRGDLVLTNQSLFKTLWTWVSTQIYGASSTTAKNTFAVFIQTQGSSVNCSIVLGTLELYFSNKILDVFFIFSDLLLKKEILFINSFM